MATDPARSKLVKRIAKHAGVDVATATLVVESFATLLLEDLASEGTAAWPGVVDLRVVESPATTDRKGINPFTKEPITIKGRPASFKLRAIAARALQKEVARLRGVALPAEDERFDDIAE